MAQDRSIPTEHREFFADLSAVFKKHAGMGKIYSIAVQKQAYVSGCCQWCADDDGNTYCCESGDDCL